MTLVHPETAPDYMINYVNNNNKSIEQEKLYEAIGIDIDED